MQKSCRFSFMYGELTDKNTISALNDALENHTQEQYEILLYKKNRKFVRWNWILKLTSIFKILNYLDSNLYINSFHQISIWRYTFVASAPNFACEKWTEYSCSIPLHVSWYHGTQTAYWRGNER